VKVRLGWLALVAAPALAFQVPALLRGDIAALVQDVREDRWPAAMARLDVIGQWIGQQMPLTVRSAVVVNHDHRGLGVFEPAAQAAVLSQHLRIYVELDGIVQDTPKPGQWHSVVVVEGEFFAMGSPGEEVNRIGRMSLGNQEITTTDSRPRTSFTTDVQLAKDTAPGRYQVVLHVSSGKKTAAVPVDFVISP
jgi:muramidase (phage lysozyme)